MPALRHGEEDAPVANETEDAVQRCGVRFVSGAAERGGGVEGWLMVSTMGLSLQDLVSAA
ncbi:hypothetical protein Fmac_005676 [Flemingia macrophylla]|uniref:Uncharacterized protein n=1 Tax=Flemingia macrophylla TaxID=520843 RepID=A0ABD1N8G0_9FABA